MEGILFKSTIETRDHDGHWDFREDSMVCVDGVHVKYRDSRSTANPTSKISVVETIACDGTCQLKTVLTSQVIEAVKTFLSKQ